MAAEIKKLENYILVTVDRDISGKECLALQQQISEFIPNSPEGSEQCHVVIDVNKRHSFDFHGIRMIVQLRKKLAAVNGKLLVVNASRDTENYLNHQGSGAVFLKSLEELKTSVVGKEEAGIDAGFINVFIEAALSVLKMQCSLDSKALKPRLKDTAKDSDIGIAGVIGLSSKVFNGSVALCFPTATFLSIMSGMLGEEFKEIDDDVADGAGELLNIIFGHAKIKLNENGHTIEKAIPTIVRGEQLKVQHYANQQCIVIPFESNVGAFQIEIAI